VSSPERDPLNPVETIRAVICYIRDGKRFLLLLKTANRFGGGFWNGPGGKIQGGESEEAAAKREVLEETGLSVEDLEKIGYLEFWFGPGKPKPDWTAQVFVTSTFKGELRESVEGKLQWFEEDQLPLFQMWQDDPYWLPLLIQGRKFHGRFQFSKDSKELLSYDVEEKAHF
jgi:8-oxo-dGTP pyrophosphatase MutT (NUDIX family)